MKPSEVADILNEVETTFPVHRWMMQGVHLWPILRIILYYRLDPFDGAPMAKKTPAGRLRDAVAGAEDLFRSLSAHFSACLSDFRANDRCDRAADVIFLGHATCRFFKVGGKWYDVYYGPLSDRLRSFDKKGLLLEMASRRQYRVPRAQPSCLIQARLFALRIQKRLKPLSAAGVGEPEGFADFVRFLERRVPGISPPTVASLRREMDYIRSLAGYFREIIRRSGATLGVVVCYYSAEGMAFNLACREAGIPSVDIQHGLQGPLHAAYGRWSNVPEQGYGMLPALFWCWSDREAKTILQWSSKVASTHRPVVCGNLMLKAFLQKESELAREFSPRVLAAKEKTGNATHVLVTLQTGRGVPVLVRQALSLSPDTYHWWIRLHPNMMPEREKIRALVTSAGGSKVNVDEASDLPLYALLPHMDVHVTELSTVVIESDQFGVPSVIIDEKGRELFGQYLESGAAVAASSPEETIEAIRSLAAAKQDRPVHPPDVHEDTDCIDRFIAQYCGR